MIESIKPYPNLWQLSEEDEKRIDLSVVVPVYDEHDSLKLLHEKISSVMGTQNLEWEVIYVDDGSRDGSSAILLWLQRSDPHVTVAVQRRNFGKSAALAVGFSLARGEVFLTIDADLQDEPAEIPNLLDALNDGCDVAVGRRKKRLDPWTKRIPSWTANSVTRLLTGLDIHDMNSGLKAYRRECIERISLYGDMHRYIPILAHFAGFKVGEVSVVHHPRPFGYSKYSGGRFIRGGLDLLGVMLVLIGVQILSLGLLAEMFVAYVQKNESALNTTTKIYRGQIQTPTKETLNNGH